MIVLDRCGRCENSKALKDGWKPICDAFPDGKPKDFTEKDGQECNNGIQFKEKEDNLKI